jgi:hypothetical protein
MSMFAIFKTKDDSIDIEDVGSGDDFVEVEENVEDFLMDRRKGYEECILIISEENLKVLSEKIKEKLTI